MSTLVKHFVIFYSPGTFFDEQNSVEVSSWDVNEAIRIAGTIHQRYDSRPYGFRFVTRERRENDWESREIAQSAMYFLGGEIKARGDFDKERDFVLLANMDSMEIEKVIVTRTPWVHTAPFREGDQRIEIESGNGK